MEKRIEYYCKKIDKAIKCNNKSDAEMYYKKALKNVGDNEEILAFKSSIENIKVKTANEEFLSQENSKIVKSDKEASFQENSKTLKSNEGLITLIAVLVAAAVLIIYCCTSIFPKYSLYRKLNHTWYVGDVSTSHSDGLALEFKFDDNYTFELSYRFWKDSDYFAISTFSGQILNGKEISLDGRTIKVNFEENGEIVVFSPSFIGLGDKSTWKMYDIGIGGNEYFEGADFASSITSSNSQNTTSNKKNSSGSEFTNSSYDTEDKVETNTSLVNNTINNSGASSKPSSSNITSSKPVSSTQTTSKPTVAKDPCADGHSWKDATCTTPKTCSVCKKTSGKALGHELYIAKCINCGHTDYSNLSGTYGECYGFYSGPYEEFDMPAFKIDSKGTLSFEMAGQKYSLKVVQVNTSYYDEDSNFVCYSSNGKKENDIQLTVTVNHYEGYEVYIINFTWEDFNGYQEMYFHGEKEVR